MISEGGVAPPESVPPEVPESDRLFENSSAGTSAMNSSAVAGHESKGHADHGFVDTPRPSVLSLQMNKLWTRVASRALERVGRPALEIPPEVLVKAYRRTQLAEDLLNEVKEGTYSSISKRSVAVIGAGLALASKLGQSTIPAATRFGSACIALLVTELWAEELRRYCRFKNYELQHYFG